MKTLNQLHIEWMGAKSALGRHIMEGPTNDKTRERLVQRERETRKVYEDAMLKHHAAEFAARD